MKKIVAALIISTLALAGCQDKPKTEAPTNQQAAGQPAGHPPTGMPGTAPQAMGAKTDPHAGIQSMDIPAGAPTKKATVVQTIDAKSYTYIEAKGDDGKNVWIAVPSTKVEKGAKIEYQSDVPPTPNFNSPSLKRTFDNLYMLSGVKVLK